jgi:hypothetical protein
LVCKLDVVINIFLIIFIVGVLCSSQEKLATFYRHSSNMVPLRLVKFIVILMRFSLAVITH